MTRFLRRGASEDEAGGEAPPLDADNGASGSGTEKKTTSRRRGSRGGAGRRAAKAASDGGSTRRRGGRRKSATTEETESSAAKSSAEVESASEKKPAPRRRASSRRKSAPKTEAPASSGDPIADALAEQSKLLERQVSLLEKQQEALTALAAVQARPSGAAAQGPLNPTVEVQPRLAIFVDVPNILYAAERSQVNLDWGKVAEFLSQGRTLVRAVAYAPISDDPSARRENERFVVPFMDKGYRIVTKELKRFTGGSVKANFDVELAMDILTMADRLDVIVLVSGDGDFRRLLEIVGSRGVRVEVMAFGQSTSRDLREAADRYIDMAAYVPQLSV